MEQFIGELKSVIKGQVLSDEESLEHYSKDGSVFEIKPWAVVLPSSKDDIFALVKWLAETKKKLKKELSPEEFKATDAKLSVTCRGRGTDQAGGPINEGIIVRFPGFLDKILEIGDGFVRVEPGVIWKTVLDELEKKGEFVPSYPASKNFASIGGGVANNCAGEKTVKYGSTRDYVLALKVVLSDGGEREFKFSDAAEIEKKQAQSDLEGEIYRSAHDLLVSNHNLIQNSRLDVNKSSSGYWVFDVLSEEGVDFSKMICGDQGTLGILTEITLKTVKKPPLAGLLLASFDDLRKAGEAVPKILELKPSAFELVDKFLLEMVKEEKPEAVAAFLKDGAAPEIILLIEFDGEKEEEIKRLAEAAKTILKEAAVDLKEAYDKDEQNKLWEVRRSAAIVAESAKGAEKALPFIEDSAVHPRHLADYLRKLYEIVGKYGVGFSVWGHAGNANLHLQPFLDLKKDEDKEKMFAIADEVYREVIRLRGALSGEHNDGLMRSPYLKDSFGEPLYGVFAKMKSIFDPLGIFNPHKKIGVELDWVKKHARNEYEIEIGKKK